MRSINFLFALGISCGLLFSLRAEEEIVARKLVATDGITVVNAEEKRLDLIENKRWALPLSMKLEGFSSAYFSQKEMQFLISSQSHVIMGASAKKENFKELEKIPRYKSGSDLVLLSGSLWIHATKKFKIERELRTRTHLLKWTNASFRVEARKGRLLVEVLEGIVESFDLWVFPGDKKKLDSLHSLHVDPLKGNEVEVISEKRVSFLMNEFSIGQPAWARGQALAKDEAMEQVLLERKVDDIKAALAPERRIETGHIKRDAHFGVEY